jgi:tRNA A-37 threonylcarbamoyl transferase component Bud32
MSEELLSQQQQTAARLLAIGGLEKQQIADSVGISRATLWNWEKTDKMKAEVDRVKREFQNFGKQLMENKLHDAVQGYWDLIKKTNNDMVAKSGYEYFIDRSLGKNSNKVEITTSLDTANVSADILEEEHAKWERDIIDVDAEEV